MAAKNTKPGAGDGNKPRTLLCPEWEALLMDALDGTLTAADNAAFYAHRETCLACAQLLEDTKRGGEWLHFLHDEPEVPGDLVARILAQTSGASDNLDAQVAIAGMPAAAVTATTWQAGWLPGLERRAAQSRWMMTAAMAFFSIAFTLNMTGVKLTGLKLSDLKPSTVASSLTRQFYVADAHFMRYYDNLRFVYELESRVRQLRQNVSSSESTTQPGDQPAKPDDNKQSPAAAPSTTTPRKTGGGSARRGLPGPASPEAAPGNAAPADELTGEPVMAGYPSKPFRACAAPLSVEQCSIRKQQEVRSIQFGSTEDRAERSLA